MARNQIVQEPFLNMLRRDKVPVAVYLLSGIKLQGQIDWFDQFVVLLKSTTTQMIFKHAISTIVPARNIDFLPKAFDGQDSANEAASH